MASSSGSEKIVMIPVDSSEHSARAVNYYFDYLYNPSDTVIVFHVPEPVSLPVMSISEGATTPVKNWENKLVERVKKIKDLEDDYNYRLTKKKLASHLVVVSHIDGTGKELLGKTIVLEAAKRDVDLIVMVNNGLGKMQRAVFGSISDYVMHHAYLPVLVIPPDKHARRLSERKSSFQ